MPKPSAIWCSRPLVSVNYKVSTGIVEFEQMEWNFRLKQRSQGRILTHRRYTSGQSTRQGGRASRRGDSSYPLSATFFYPPPSFTEFTCPDEVEVHGDEVPEDILPRQEDELNQLDYQQCDAAVAVSNRTFEEMEKIIDEIFEGRLGSILSSSGSLL